MEPLSSATDSSARMTPARKDSSSFSARKHYPKTDVSAHLRYRVVGRRKEIILKLIQNVPSSSIYPKTPNFIPKVGSSSSSGIENVMMTLVPASVVICLWVEIIL
jgi:hypothetical protein